MNRKQSDSAQAPQSQAPLPHEIDAAPPPTDEPVIHLPSAQEATEAARTGLEDQSDRIGAEIPNSDLASERSLTAGDPDASALQASTVGEEAIGGTTPTPEQNNVDDIAAAVGLDTQPEHPVAVIREMQHRDDQRFELDPDSKDAAS
ncbi:DUF6335 family protein [Nodosilinea sp. PGN35]|uniref:DUF6335 family protein n=1 Tax=Nodosilinea sp. PGN35 TaxID=3020489 RepID=UPI0023B2B414|nr:DUF6335 family protein [Nodosilinea sp. TSF1-S3]MDF0366666.1 DUF6335 family protein [Nodosilinea sp. TSF1-S3]